MSVIHPSDADLHYEDGSHRWSGGPADPAGQEAWRAQLDAHIAAHQEALRRPPIPQQRSSAR